MWEWHVDWRHAQSYDSANMNRKRMFWAVGLWGLTAQAVCVNGHPSVTSEYLHSQTVVVASVVAEKSIPEAPDGYFLEGTEYTVRVEKKFRGPALATLELFNENTSGRFDMTVGTKYLLFVYQDHGRLRIDNCGNSGELSKSASAFRQVEKLGRPKN
jgi:hypothetical protein